MKYRIKYTENSYIYRHVKITSPRHTKCWKMKIAFREIALYPESLWLNLRGCIIRNMMKNFRIIFHVPFFSRFLETLCTFFSILKNNAYLVMLLCFQTWCSQWIDPLFVEILSKYLLYIELFILSRAGSISSCSVPIIGVYELKILHL